MHNNTNMMIIINRYCVPMFAILSK